MSILVFENNQLLTMEKFPYLKQKGFNLERELPIKNQEGIFGSFNVNSREIKPNVLIFYPNGNPKIGFHHPKFNDFAYPNHGFWQFYREEMLPYNITISGAMVGKYNIDEKSKLTLFFDIEGHYNLEFDKEILDLGLVKKIKKIGVGIEKSFFSRFF